MQKTGLYVHIPFCEKKCPYCDFYSLCNQHGRYAEYIEALLASIRRYAGQGITADTLYFGGGTPILLDAELLCKVISLCREQFSLDGEITIEANPCVTTFDKLSALRKGGVNRISFGMQSAVAEEQQVLGRRHTTGQVRQAVKAAKSAGFDNISVDIMLGTPKQTLKHLEQTLSVLDSLQIQHVSAYLLKIEPDTPFYDGKILRSLPSEDDAADHYLYVCRSLSELGFRQYEISNFAGTGYESRHNLKYWRLAPYLGFGPSAHSYHQGQRFFYPRDLDAFLKADGGNVKQEPLPDSPAFDYVMLGMRLSEGISLSVLKGRYGVDCNPLIARSEKYQKAGYLVCKGDSLAMTPQGFLVSNSILTDLLSDLEG